MRVMAIRVFLRGGYRTLTSPTLVSRHGVPLFTVYPPYPKDTAQWRKVMEQPNDDFITAARLAAGEGVDRELQEEVPEEGTGQ